ncbi:MAG TPA: hypothetical protein DCE41_37770 [Cytophagales bacterium]|nr:hypothetical protein [Cytophagales bacterium]HAA22369.1 hypothetical protein [Cytophagales bacterium]HAP62192.1 hypothetical protein [Cytophagales bacterium]
MNDTIGYAIFGSPRGLQVVSNGLFQSLQLDSHLYLKHEHIILEEGEQVLMCKRIATKPSSTVKDGLLVAIYQHAWPHGERRAGGFVGSAICFRRFLPSLDKMANGLWYLFDEIRKQTDENHRFLSVDSKSWNINLPNANQDFGFLRKEVWQYKSNNDFQNIALCSPSLRHSTSDILFNLCFNDSFYQFEHVYATHTQVVFEKLKKNALGSVSFTALFDHSKQHERAIAQYQDLQRRIAEGDRRLKQLAEEYQPKANYLKQLEGSIYQKESHILELKEAIRSLNLKFVEAISPEYKKFLDTKHDRLVKTIDEDEIIIKEKQADIEKLDQKIKSLVVKKEKKSLELNIDENAQTVQFAAQEINKFYHPGRSLNEHQLIEDYFEFRKHRSQERREQTKIYRGIIIGLTVLILVLAGRLFFGGEGNSVDSEIERLKADIQEQKVATQTFQNRVSLLSDIQRYQKHSTQADYQKFRPLADELLTKFAGDEYSEGDPEYAFITSYDWEFWEFDFLDANLVEEWKSPYEDSYYINLQSHIVKDKPTHGNFRWIQNDIRASLIKYLNDSQNNDLYQFIAQANGNDIEIINGGASEQDLLKHFEWMLREFNDKNASELAKETVIYAPFFK